MLHGVPYLIATIKVGVSVDLEVTHSQINKKNAACRLIIAHAQSAAQTNMSSLIPSSVNYRYFCVVRCTVDRSTGTRPTCDVVTE